MKKSIAAIAIIALTVSAQAGEIDRAVERFADIAYLAEAHCKDVYGETDRCLDRQFNCFVEVRNLQGISDTAFDKAIRDASTYNREGHTIAVDFCEFKRKARLYDLQEYTGKMQKQMDEGRKEAERQMEKARKELEALQR